MEATLYQIPETLHEKILEKVKANPRLDDVPEIHGEQLAEADGFIFGFPSRFRVIASQFMTFFDNTNDLWTSQTLVGKPAGIFWSTVQINDSDRTGSSRDDIVPLGYTFGKDMYETGEAKGGSPYGSGTYAPDGSRKPTELEIQHANYHGKYFTMIAKKLKNRSPA
ncbi:unnamed protein product [Thlaspi arvense]|uniref:NAD(P)H dehydrogenase (quinone) n=1 Tax=Thlaspi arvense TaxID=13288 RepID=A0AAU9SRY2_THLAR|nr:unnamed protein product [Thlaspi arvense]